MRGDIFISFFDSIPLWIMLIPIFICSIIALSVIIERLVFFRRIDHDYRHILRNIMNLITEDKTDEARRLCDEYSGSVIQIIKDLFMNLDKKDTWERVIQESSEYAVRGIERNVGLISTIATISPMLGLLGTVTGMMKSFSGLASVGPVAHDLLAYGISEALITTAFGLLVAIPSLIFYNYLVVKVDLFIKEVEYVANGLLEIE